MGRAHKPTTTTIAATATIALAAILSSCGSSNTTKTTAGSTTPPATQTQARAPTATSRQTPAATTTASSKPPPHELTVERVEVSSPAVNSKDELDPRYTCSGQNIPLPLRWKGIPPGTHELMLEVIKLKPVNHQLYYAWALTHISPSSKGIKPGETPPGAITGQNGAGRSTYDLCPPKGHPETYVIALFALPHPLPTKPAYNPHTQRKEAEEDADYVGYNHFTTTRH